MANISSDLEQQVLKTVFNVVMSMDGVNRLSGNLTENLSRSLLGIENPYRGIKISGDIKDLTLDIYIMVNFGENIPQLSWKLQNAVFESIKSQVGIKLNKININVQGVSLRDR